MASWLGEMMINHGPGEPPEWDAYFERLHADGNMIEDSFLDHLVTAKSGTFSTDNKKSATGYIAIWAKDLNDAKRIILASPAHKAGGTVELFAFV